MRHERAGERSHLTLEEEANYLLNNPFFNGITKMGAQGENRRERAPSDLR